MSHGGHHCPYMQSHHHSTNNISLRLVSNSNWVEAVVCSIRWLCSCLFSLAHSHHLFHHPSISHSLFVTASLLAITFYTPRTHGSLRNMHDGIASSLSLSLKLVLCDVTTQLTTWRLAWRWVICPPLDTSRPTLTSWLYPKSCLSVLLVGVPRSRVSFSSLIEASYSRSSAHGDTLFKQWNTVK